MALVIIDKIWTKFIKDLLKMATNPIIPNPIISIPTTNAVPTANLAVSLNDPISSDIQAVCGAVVALCGFLSTAQGQALLIQAQKNNDTFTTWISSAWKNFTGLFKKG